MSSVVKTRFAPSPTGYLHIGGARTALFSYAFARHHGGEFVLRVEDTDLERSTPESVQAILDGMAWLNLEHDGEIVFQTQRFERYRAVIADMLAAGTAYLCYASKEELAQMRAEAEARGETPRYDRRWRPENGKVLPPVPADIQPVVRFKTPLAGSVVWDDLVKGRIEIGNIELDDLVIARADGVPTYNFCVVVDDWDMAITHVLRGDDHINNTPRQIHILQALGAPLPAYGHLPMILGPDGQKLSKRHGAAAVTEYRDMGLLPEAVVNYLARLGWSHGDDELFDRAQMVSWFDETGINPAPARLDFDKLKWVNAHWMKQADLPRLADLLRPFLANLGVQDTGEIDLPAVVGLYRERVDTLLALAEAVAFFFTPPPVDEALQAQHLTDLSRPAVAMLAAQLQTAEWTQPALAAVLKETVAAAGVKFPQLAMPVRVLVCGTTQTPSLDAVLVLLPRERVLSRLAAV